MIVRAIKNDEDVAKRAWVFCKGLSAYKSKQKAIEQIVKSSLLEFKNDCYFALNNGIDWITRLGYKNQKSLLDVDVQKIILEQWGVLNVQNFQSSIIERYYNCSCEVYTIFSEDAYIFTFNNGI